jgi:hypothetical protein
MGADLRPETIQAWQRYVHATETRMYSRLHSGKHFLLIDSDPEEARRVRSGEVVVAPSAADNPVVVPAGLIHDWTATVFIPDTDTEHVLGMLRDYHRYKALFRPLVLNAKRTGGDVDEDRFSMTWVRKSLFASTALTGEYDSRFVKVDEDRWYSITRSTCLRQIVNLGHRDQRVLAPGSGNGYVWRVWTSVRYAQRDGGVYIEVEALVLSRDIPSSARWFVDPLVRRLARNSLISSLRQTRAAVRISADSTLAAAGQ